MHVRQYELKGERMYPTRIGTCMSPCRFKAFCTIVGKIQEAKEALYNGVEAVNIKEHIGGGVNVSLKTGNNCVDIRRYFMTDVGVAELPTRKGISLKFAQWDRLVERLEDIKRVSPILMNAELCSSRTDHSNLMGFLDCRECNPYGDVIGQ